jgi:hypothetical protein
MNDKKIDTLREKYREQIGNLIRRELASDEAFVAGITACADIMAAMSLVCLSKQREAEQICHAALTTSLGVAARVRKLPPNRKRKA